jgi:Asp-tRNA(Asn)/Glu-tRNA(Gln) amidotransferase A subunit family amidase
VALGMAAFDWGGDFAGSIRMPAGFCGIAGVRLSNEAWPTDDEHFPDMPKVFQELLGWGPLARTIEGCRAVIRATRPHLRANGMPPPMHEDEVVVYAPDARTIGRWPTFFGDVALALNATGVRYERDRRLPSPVRVNALFNEYLCANFDAFVGSGELPFREALPAVALGLLSQGRLDRRVHPNTGVLLASSYLGSVSIYRDKSRPQRALDALRDTARQIWGERRLIVAPMATLPAPKHGRAGLERGLQTFCKLGNLIDATAAVVPFGRFDGGLPRSLQILGPPGSEESVMSLAARLEGYARDTWTTGVR